MKSKHFSHLPINIRTYCCEQCDATFYEMDQATISKCPHCMASLSGQQMEPLHEDPSYALQVDPITGIISLVHTGTGEIIPPRT